jgi:hypothetical protein
MAKKTRQHESVTRVGVDSARSDTKHARNGPGADSIREQAYRIYEARMSGGTSGDELADWLEAERTVSAGRDHA